MVGAALDSVEPARGYLRAHDLPFPVVVLDDPRDAAVYRIPGVPLTMVLDEVGRILFVRSGLFDLPAADARRAFLQVLPSRKIVVSELL